MSNLLSKASILLTPTATSDGKLHNIKPNTTTGDFTFTRGTVATRVNSNGLIESVASGLPRIDFTGGIGQVLLEPASTNLITHSEDLTSSGGTSFQNNATSLSTTSPSPDGGTNAFTFIYDGTFNSSVKKQTAVSADEVITFSVFIKKTANTPTFSSDTNIKIGIFSNVVSTVTLPLGNALNAATVGEWVRYSVTATADSDGGNVVPNLRCDVAAQFDVFGWQLETNSFVTSYIPTSGGAVTRNKDEANSSGDTSLINSTEGVLYAEIAALANSGNSRFICLSDGTNQNVVILGYISTDDRIRIFIKSSNSTQANNTATTVTATNFNKIAVKYKENDFALFVNGTETFSDTSGSAPIGLNELEFEFGSGSLFEGKIKTVAVFKEALTDAQLISLTS